MNPLIERAVHWAPAIVLAPLLVAQGWHVRRVTPRLPEPPGERSGQCAGKITELRRDEAPHLRLLLVGDSAAAGVGASSQASALTGQLVSALAGDFSLVWKLSAESGIASAELIRRLHAEPSESFDMAVVSIGVNDVIGGVRLADWQHSLRQLAQVLQQRFAVRHVLFSPLPPMHRFTALPQPLRWVIGRRARRFNQLLGHFVAANPACHLVPLDYPLEASYLADDGFHPGEPAYTFWAGQIAGQVRGLAC